MLTKGEQKMVDNILENFNFQKCYDVMTILKWTWGFNSYSPSIEDLKQSAVEKLQTAILGVKDKEVHEHYYVSSGGIKASAYKNRYNRVVMLHLEFVLTEWDSDGD
jgi:hypothetical protein